MTPITAFSARDFAFMDLALAQSAARLGRTAPNPSVGCVIARGDQILACAATGEGGRPHAEALALSAAGPAAAGAEAFVTLEPCATRSVPGEIACADRLIAAQLSRVVIACADPHPHGAGGARRLIDAGLLVEFGLREAEAIALNVGFFTLCRTGFPFVAVAGEAFGYDAVFSALPRESFAQALRRFGADGITRLRVDPTHPLAAEARNWIAAQERS
ncbi:MAG TPA: hypothetical protein DCZ49_04850 [Hyphomonadaceae bacterium]|nr:hypothetical protein [Hyphomonadaceae bacterium]